MQRPEAEKMKVEARGEARDTNPAVKAEELNEKSVKQEGEAPKEAAPVSKTG